VGAAEFFELARLRGERPFAGLGLLAAVAVVLLAAAWPAPMVSAGSAVLVLVGVVVVCLAASIWLRWPGGSPLGSVSVTVTGVLYVGCTLAFIPLLRDLGAAYLLLPLLATWAGDSLAFFAGRTWGKARLAPEASPGKTVVGAVAGLVGSVVAACAISWWTLRDLPPPLAVPVYTAAWMGLVLGAAGQLGDLAESVLKREAGVKDSGRILPGHGGVLDRVDALLFAIPVAWLLLWATGVVAEVGP
jgi:phosphatidate cytidylyltransferase